MSTATEVTEKHLRHDLRASAIHEAAHVAVVRHYGKVAQAWCHPTYTADPMEEKLVVGQTMFDERGLDEHRLRMVGLAGSVAEACDDDPDVDGEALLEHLEMDIVGLSATDAQFAGTYTAGDLDDCIALVREHWDEIEMEAEHLSGMLLDLLRQDAAREATQG